MNQRKDILERVKHIMKEQPELKVNCSKLARRLNCDRRTVSRYVEIAKNGEKPPQRTVPSPKKQTQNTGRKPNKKNDKNNINLLSETAYIPRFA